MSGVPASRRGGSRFEAQHHFYKLRDEVTMLVMNDFGYSADKDERRIEKLSGNYIFLKMKYSLSATGNVIRKIAPESVTRERRRLKAYKRLLDDGRITYDTIEQAYKSWMGRYTKFMSKQQRKNLQQLYQELFEGRNPRWKK